MPTRYHGSDAVKKAIEYYSPAPEDISDDALQIIRHEGFVPGTYLDSKGIETEGVGLTGEFAGKDFFKEVMPVFRERAKTVVPDYDNLPARAQRAVMSAVYRGDLKASHRTAKLLREGKYKEAAAEYLNNEEYRSSKAKNQKAGKVVDGIQIRMEENAAAFASAV